MFQVLSPPTPQQSQEYIFIINMFSGCFCFWSALVSRQHWLNLDKTLNKVILDLDSEIGFHACLYRTFIL